MMRLPALLVIVATGICAAADDPVKIWPGQPPGEAEPIGPERNLPPSGNITRTTDVSEPTLTLYRPPAGKANGTAVVICPGGGSNILAADLEGSEVAEWLNSIGVTAAVLKYRVPRRKHDPENKLPLQDAQRAMRLMRKNAADWGFDRSRIGILGFSAGGHLAFMTATRFDAPQYTRIDDADDFSSRPDFVIPIYAAYLGDKTDRFKLAESVRITKDTPPAFLAVTHDDDTRASDAALTYVELKRNGVPAELHIFVKGGHGYGLRPSANAVSGWPKLCEQWLRTMGLLGGK